MTDFEETIENIIEIAANSRFQGRLAECTQSFCGGNPSCGDEVLFDVKIENGIVTDLRYSCKGCTISKAAAAVVADQIIGKTVTEVLAMQNSFSNNALGEVVQIRQGCVELPLKVIKSGLVSIGGSK